MEQRAEALSRKSARLMGLHDHFAQGLVAAEIGVALASIAALTERHWLLGSAVAAALIAVSFGALGLMS